MRKRYVASPSSSTTAFDAASSAPSAIVSPTYGVRENGALTAIVSVLSLSRVARRTRQPAQNGAQREKPLQEAAHATRALPSQVGRPHVVVGGDLGKGAGRDPTAGLENRHLVGDAADEAQVVLDHEEREAACSGARGVARRGGRARLPTAPAAGSSSSRTRGSVARADASMSRRCSWAVSSTAGRSGSCRPTSSARRALSLGDRFVRRAFGVRRHACGTGRRAAAEAGADERVLERGQLGEDRRRLLRADDSLPSTRALRRRPVELACRSRATDPASGTSSPTSALSAVVLPAPFGPISACTAPGSSSRSRSSRATRLPKRFERPRAPQRPRALDTGGTARQAPARRRSQGRRNLLATSHAPPGAGPRRRARGRAASRSR